MPDMSTADLLDEALGGVPRRVTADDEAAWVAARPPGGGVAGSIAAAVAGGLRADRPAWVFLAGYQAAIHRCFPVLPRDALAAYVVSEDREGRLPGVTTEPAPGGLRLTGYRTWVAAAAHVTHLVVAIGRGDAQRFALPVPRDAPGLRIETGPPAGFLPELTQGRAAFDATPVGEPVGDAGVARAFGLAEPLHVLAALHACMLGRTRELGGPPEIAGRAAAQVLAADAIAPVIPDRIDAPHVAAALLGIAEETADLAAEFEAWVADADPAFHGRWQRDRRLVEMFRAGARRRAGLGPA